MALPPTVPTSFVPRPGATAVKRRADFTGAFAFIGYGVLAVVIALALGAFIYSQILTTEQARKDAELKRAIDAIDPQTVTKFVHLRDRLSRGLALLDQHVALTGFWATLAAVAPASVRFDDLKLSRDDTGQMTLAGSGIAKSFNALAAASDAFAKDGRIRDAIFSDIRVEAGAVSFSLTAAIEPSLVEFRAPASVGAAPPESAPAALP